MDLRGDLPAWLNSLSYLFWPLLLALWLAIGDVRTHRIPNYLNVIICLSGFGYQIGFAGWHGAAQSIMGLCLGFGLLIIPYLLGGMGAGDVKALAALGAWLGPWGIFILFFYMALAGGLLALVMLWWRGLLWKKIHQGWVTLVNWLLRRPFGGEPAPTAGKQLDVTNGIPYGVAIALGMMMVYVRGTVL
jgi:prepilin peptidase CpaA